MARDQMTPLQRFAAYAAGEGIDRLPCVPIVGNSAARVLGVKVGEFRGNGRLIAEAQVASYLLFGYDVIRIFTDLYTQAEAMGAAVQYPEDETAYLAAPALSDISQLNRLRPADPYRDGNLPQHLEAMRRTVDAVGSEVPVTGALTCPFTNASFLVGAEQLARLMMRDHEAVHRLCELSLQSSLAYADAIIAAGCTPSLTDAMSSMSVIGPRQFREFSLPYLRRLIAHLHGRGKSVTLHICGKTAGIWEAMVEAGADCLSIDNDASLTDAKRAVGDRVRLMGNVHPSEVMLQGTPARVRQATLKCVAEARDNPRGFIVATGCSLPTETPLENIRAMLDAVREAGPPAKLSSAEADGA